MMSPLRRFGNGSFSLQWRYVLIVIGPILVFLFAELMVGNYTQTPSFKEISAGITGSSTIGV